jgi:hypothetical protein
MANSHDYIPLNRISGFTSLIYPNFRARPSSRNENTEKSKYLIAKWSAFSPAFVRTVGSAPYPNSSSTAPRFYRRIATSRSLLASISSGVFALMFRSRF